VPAGQQSHLEERLRFETFLSELVARFVLLPAEDVDAAIQESLERLVPAIGVERCTLLQFGPKGKLSWSHGFAISEIPWPGQATDLTPFAPWYAAELRKGRRLVLDRMPDDLPPDASEERAFAAKIGVKSHLALPLQAGGEVLGALTVGAYGAYRVWEPELVPRLELLASVFANALYRRDSEAQLRESHELNRRTLADLEKSLEEVRALKERLEAENVVLQEEIRHARGFDEIVGTGPALARVLRQVEQVAATDSPVLLLGETGTGKDLVASALHARGPRKDRPLVTVNCAALPVTLIESELFGYEKGAYTGATARTPGRFEAAHEGSILLDEIGELPLEAQAKLLRVLQTGEFERLGSAKTLKVDVRVIAATNRDLANEVREGRFRADLYYRLSVFPIALPPLRERPEDIPLLVWHFIARKQAKLGRRIERIPDRVMRSLVAHSWPGNVRELENVLERALILSSGSALALDPLVLDTPGSERSPQAPASLADVERAHILAVLESCGWKVAGRMNAAERLGLNRSTLQCRMQKLGIKRPRA